MLTPYLKSQFIEKILTDRYGRQFRCLFLVALVDGEIKGKLVYIQQIYRHLTSVNSVNPIKLCLPFFGTSKKIFTEHIWLPIISYFAPKDFSFVMSQMTRAPSSN